MQQQVYFHLLLGVIIAVQTCWNVNYSTHRAVAKNIQCVIYINVRVITRDLNLAVTVFAWYDTARLC
jgi:hypothetical protein